MVVGLPTPAGCPLGASADQTIAARGQMFDASAPSAGPRHRGGSVIIDRGDEYRHGDDTPPPGSGPIEYSNHAGRILRVH